MDSEVRIWTVKLAKLEEVWTTPRHIRDLHSTFVNPGDDGALVTIDCEVALYVSASFVGTI